METWCLKRDTSASRAKILSRAFEEVALDTAKDEEIFLTIMSSNLMLIEF